MPVFPILAAVMTILKIAGVGGFASLSWWLIAVVWLLPLVFIVGPLLLAMAGAITVAGVSAVAAPKRRRR